MSKNKYFHFFGESKPNLILTKDEAVAIRSIALGNATQHQQIKAFKLIVEKICKVPHSSFATDPNITNFNEGARWVGIMLAQTISADLDIFVDPKPGILKRIRGALPTNQQK